MSTKIIKIDVLTAQKYKVGAHSHNLI